MEKSVKDDFDIILEKIEYLPFRTFVVMGNDNFEEIKKMLISDGMQFISARMVFISESDFNSFYSDESKSCESINEHENLILNLYDRWLHHLQVEKKDFKLVVNLGMGDDYKKDLYFNRISIESTARLFRKFIIEDFCDSDLGASVTNEQLVCLLNYDVERGAATSHYGFLYNWLSSAYDDEGIEIVYPRFMKIFDKYFDHHHKLFEKKISKVETLPPIFRPNSKIVKDHKVETLDFNNINNYKGDADKIHKIHKISKAPNEKHEIAYIRHSPEEKESYYYKDYLSGSQIFIRS